MDHNFNAFVVKFMQKLYAGPIFQVTDVSNKATSVRVTGFFLFPFSFIIFSHGIKIESLLPVRAMPPPSPDTEPASPALLWLQEYLTACCLRCFPRRASASIVGGTVRV